MNRLRRLFHHHVWRHQWTNKFWHTYYCYGCDTWKNEEAPAQLRDERRYQ